MTRPTKAEAMYAAVDEHIREDLGAALDWARKTLTDHEGGGHEFQVHPDRGDALCNCTFSKPAWAGEHSGSCMGLASEAVVMAVCEYFHP